MKRLFFIVAMLLTLGAMAQAQNLNGFFEKYADDERFAYTKIGKDMQTLTLEITTSNKTLAEAVEKEILEVLKKDNFELEVASRDKAERSYIYSRPGIPKGSKETVIINKDKGEINILWTMGKDKKSMMNMGELQGLQELGDLQSMNELKNLKSMPDIE